jgi:acetyl esterase
MSLKLLSPAMAGLLDRIHRARRPPLHTLSPVEARAAYAAGAEVLDLPRAPLAVVRDFTLAGRPARLYAPEPRPLPALLYLHGGGFVIGSLETHDSLCRQLALRSGCAIVALDYRLAPEHPFPAAADDSWAALEALVRHPAEAGIERLVGVGGDSAGGTLAAVAALHARDRGWPLALQLLITPGTTAHADTPSHKLFSEGFLLDATTIAWMFDHTIPHHHRRDWRFAPLEADVDGVAPACVVLAECDPLVDEGLAYADHLRAAGVPLALELVRGVTHDFIKMGRALREAHDAQAAAAAAIQEAARR